jgi:PKD repeat protein
MTIGLKALQFVDINDTSPEVTVLDWSATRSNELSNFIDTNNLDVVFVDASSPPNVYTTSYVVPVPALISAVQSGPLTVTVTWGVSTGSDEYLLQRDTSALFLSPVNVYSGPNLTFDDVVPLADTYYYRVLARVTSLSLESFWSNVVSLTIEESVFVDDFVVVSEFIGIDIEGADLVSDLVSVSEFVSIVIFTEIPLSADFNVVTTPVGTRFINLSKGANSWLWDFGDCRNSTEQNPPLYKQRPGTYTASLTASDGVTSVTSIKTIHIPDYIEEVPWDVIDTVVYSSYNCTPPETIHLINASGNAFFKVFDRDVGEMRFVNPRMMFAPADVLNDYLVSHSFPVWPETYVVEGVFISENTWSVQILNVGGVPLFTFVMPASKVPLHFLQSFVIASLDKVISVRINSKDMINFKIFETKRVSYHKCAY